MVELKVINAIRKLGLKVNDTLEEGSGFGVENCL